MIVLDEWVTQFENLSFCEKLRSVKTINDFTEPSILKSSAAMVRHLGYLTEVHNMAVSASEGDSYVYLWRHCWGDPFYVGRGKGSRYTTLNGRCDEFYLHIDRGDAVVYIVLDGVDDATARLYERYVSMNLTQAGYTLSNGDNNFEYLSEDARSRFVEKFANMENDDLTRRVQSKVLGILNHRPRCDYRITDAFLMEYGTDYFSRNYWKKKQKRESQEA